MKNKKFISIIKFILVFSLFAIISVKPFAQELRYKGRTLREWRVDLWDLDPDMRIKAIDAVAKFGKDGVPVIIDMLSDKDAHVRSYAAIALGNIGLEAKGAIPTLVNALGDDDENVYRSAQDALDKIGPARKEAVPQLIKLLGHDNSKVRTGTINALANIEPKKSAAVPALVRALSNKDKRVRTGSAKSLRALGAAASSAVPTLIKALADENESVRESAGQALFEIVRETRDALPAVIKAIEHDNEWVRSWAAWILVALKPPVENKVAKDAILVLVKAFQHESVLYKYRDDVAEAIAKSDIAPEAKKAAVPALTKALVDEDKELRREAAKALGSIGPEANYAIPALIKALREGDENVRRNMSDALEKVGPATKQALPELITLLGDQNSRVRSRAIKTLSNIEPDESEAVPYLIEALQDDDKRVRSGSAEALKLIGPVAKDVVPALINALGDEYEAVWEPALEALSTIAKEKSDWIVPAVTKALDHENKQVRYFTAMYLSYYFETPFKEAVPVLIEALQDTSVESWVFSDAAKALGKIGPAAKDAVPSLMEALGDSNVRKRLVAASTLGDIGSAATDAVPSLTKALRDEDPNVRSAVVRALGKIGPSAKDAVPSLMKALRDEDSNVRSAAARSLGKIGQAAKGAVPVLINAMGDKDIRVRISALDGLGEIGPAAEDAVSVLMKTLKDDESVRGYAAMAIFRIRRDINEVLPPIVNALGNDAAAVFIRLLVDEDANIRRFAEESLSIMGPVGNNVLNALEFLEFIDKSNIQDVITIHNDNQFIDAIGPNRLVLLPADYSINLSNLSRKETKYVRWGDWGGLIIHDVENFAIVGLGSQRPEILVEPGERAVINFKNVINVSISNIQAGHSPATENACFAPVLQFESSSRISMNNIDLFGSGLSGLFLSDVDSLIFDNSIIRDCSWGIMTIWSSRNLEFKEGQFLNNYGNDLINIIDGSNIIFNEYDISGNSTLARWNYSLFKLSSSKNIAVKNSRIANNETEYFFDGQEKRRNVKNKVESELNLKNVSFENNTFRKGKYHR